MTEILIAWRNIWRNRRRTLISFTAVMMAVILSAMVSSMQEGTYEKMITNVVGFYSGHLQIFQPGYRDSRSINDTYLPHDSLYQLLEKFDAELIIPRLESFTLISTGENTKACALIGIDPVLEDRMSDLSSWISSGEYLDPGDEGLLLSINIAKSMNIKPGDTLVLISQGFHGSSAAALVPVKGILDFPSPQMNNLGAYIDINKAGIFFDAENRISSLVLMFDEYGSANGIKKNIEKITGENYQIMTWDEMQPELLKMIEGDRAGAIIMKGVLYLVVGFGILATIIMMMAERRKEMGVMLAVGMRKGRLQRILCYETLFMGLTGVFAGLIVCLPVLVILVKYPIPITGELGNAWEMFGIEASMYFSASPKVFLNQVLTVFIITLIVALYPIFNIANMKVIKAIRGQ